MIIFRLQNYTRLVIDEIVFIYLCNIPVPRSVTPMGNVTKYLQKLGMGVYDNENQPGVSKKIT